MACVAPKRLCTSLLQKCFISSSSISKVSCTYELVFTTGTKFGAGTDGKVHVRMIGENGSSDEIPLNTKKKDMERGMTNTYHVQTDPIGDLRKLIVRNDGSGFAPDWFLEKVKITDGLGKQYKFSCDQWFNKDPPDQSVHLFKEERYLNCTLSKDGNATVTATADDICEPSRDLSSSVSPSVRLLMHTYDVTLSSVRGTGPHSRVLKGDLLAHIKEKGLTAKNFNDQRLKNFNDQRLKNFNDQRLKNFNCLKEGDRRIEVQSMSLETELPNATLDKRSQSYMCIKCSLKRITSSDGLVTSSEEIVTSSDGLVTSTDGFVTSSDVLVRLFVCALRETFRGTEENYDLMVNKHGECYTIQNAVSQKNTGKDSPKKLISIAILPNDDISQNSTILQANEILNVCVNGAKKELNVDFELEYFTELCVTYDTIAMQELQSVQLLTKLKTFVENPALAIL